MVIFKSYNSREIKALDVRAEKILALENKYKDKTRDEILEVVYNFRKSIMYGERLEFLLDDAFAVCREVTFRVLGKKQYKVQLMAGIALHQGRVVEMKTGEGKTLTELCPGFLNALDGKGVHIITVNDYLAQRDFEEMRRVFEYMGISVGLIVNDSTTDMRQYAYACDVTYTTNTELGFDYLRDNTAKSKEMQVQRGLHYVIIDELDSVLIDEARTPLILAVNSKSDDDKFIRIKNIISALNNDLVKIDIKENYVMLNEKGVSYVEKALNIKNLSDCENVEYRHLINQGLRAKFLLFKDKDYIVENGEILLIDSNTGRIAEGRKLSDGLHQSIEAKENVDITDETITTASITYQNFFKIYNKLSGMSGTIATEESEFKEFYNLDVVVIPTNKKIERIDLKDIVCSSYDEKIKQIIKDTIETHETGRPVLIGTPTIEKSEELSLCFDRCGIEHKLLNAKTKSEEAKIISMAGEKGAITIATNIAGRGTDIKISEKVNKLGGLKVIGTERSLSRRIDNQLIGRSGRQGNNGSSQFYISPDDELFKEYTEKEIREKALKYAGNKQKKYILNNMYKVQSKIEAIGFDSRKEIIKYDDILNHHREVIYKEREKVLNSNSVVIGEELSECILEIIKSVVYDYEEIYGKEELDEINLKISKIFNITNTLEEEYYRLYEHDDIIDYYCVKVISYYNELANRTDVEFEPILRNIFLGCVDKAWVYHIEFMTDLKRSMYAQSYNQKDPLQMYKLNSGDAFNNLIKMIRESFIKIVFYNLISQLI